MVWQIISILSNEIFEISSVNNTQSSTGCNWTMFSCRKRSIASMQALARSDSVTEFLVEGPKGLGWAYVEIDALMSRV